MLKYHPDTPQTPLHTPLHIPDTNRHQQTPTYITQTPLNTPRHDWGVSDSVWQWLVMSAAVCWCLRPLGGVRGVSGFAWDKFMDVLGCLSCSRVFGRLSESSVLAGRSLGGAVIPLLNNSETQDILNLTILRDQNIKMSIYMLQKDD